MFLSLKAKLLVGLYAFLLISIPVGAYLASQSQTFKSSAKEEKSIVKNTPKPTTSHAKELLGSAESKSKSASASSTADSDPSSPTIATSFGPTLSLKVNLEGRPENNKVTKLFVGIAEGIVTTGPKFLLSFTVDLPASGSYSSLSLAGLTAGTQYTAILKAPAQIATSSAFIMAPTNTTLNEGNTLTLLTGDLNEDNVINSADYTIALKALRSTPASPNWNENVDFNKDGTVNSLDLSLITKNFGRHGASGAWTSPIPAASSSASLTPAIGGPDQNSGYWIWIPPASP